MSGRFRRRSGWRSSRFAGRRSFRNSYRRGSVASRARGNLRAAQQQNDTSEVVINLMTKVKSGVTGYENNDVKFNIGTTALNIYDLLRKSEFFESYSKMYDQFRITSVKVKLTPVNWKTYNQFNIPNLANIVKYDETYHVLPTAEPINPGQDYTLEAANVEGKEQIVVPDVQGVNETVKVTNGGLFIYPQALTVVTAWDRTGLDASQFYLKDDSDNLDNVHLCTNIGDNITTYSSAKSTQLVAGANFNCTRYLYPSSNQEKSLYLATSELKPQYDVNIEDDYYYYKLAKVGNARVPRGSISNDIITNLQSSPNCPFKPTFLIGILSVEPLGYQNDPVNTTNQIHPVLFNCEFDIGVTFRGLRKSQVV